MAIYRIHGGIPGGNSNMGIEVECADDAAAGLLAIAGMALGDSREVWLGARCIGASIAVPSDARLVGSERTQPCALLRID
jgi:hypothetical protein